MKVFFTATNSNISAFINGKMMSVVNTHPSFEEIKNHLREDEHDVATLVGLFEASIYKNANNQLKEIKTHKVSVDENGVVSIDGNPLNNYFSERVKFMFDEGYSVTPFIEFMKKLLANPSTVAIERLFAFLDKNGSPITEDGDFIAFKNVDKNFRDHYTGNFDNSVGKIVSVEREKVDPDSSRTCSYGLHVAASSYLGSYCSYNSIKIACKVNPADVVAVPPDYNETKMRVCRYEVISVMENAEAIEKVENTKIVDSSLKKSNKKDFTENKIVKQKIANVSDAVFSTSDGRKIAAKVISSLLNSGNSAAKVAKQLSVPESTMRGWIKKIKETSEPEKTILTFVRGDKTYTSDEILEGIETEGSQTRWAAERGIPSGTVSGWMKKIRENS